MVSSSPGDENQFNEVTFFEEKVQPI